MSVLELGSQYIDELLEAVETVMQRLQAAGISEGKAYSQCLDFILKVFDVLHLVRGEMGEEDEDASMVLSVFSVLRKLRELSEMHFVEHPAVVSMLIQSLLEIQGGQESKSLEGTAKEALNKATEAISKIEATAETAKKSHDAAADALNQLNQLKKKINAKKDVVDK